MTLLQRATELVAAPRERLELAFGFKPTPYALTDGDKGAIPAAFVNHRHFDVARAAANAAASGDDAMVAVAVAVKAMGSVSKGEKQRHEKTAQQDTKDKKDTTDKTRRRTDVGPDAAGVSGPTDISGDTRITSQ